MAVVSLLWPVFVKEQDEEVLFILKYLKHCEKISPGEVHVVRGACSRYPEGSADGGG